MRFLVLIIILTIAYTVDAQDSNNSGELRAYMDMQMHPTMHVPYNFFGNGFEYFDENNPPHLKYKHQFKNVNYANYWKNNSGARIIIAGSLTSEWVKNRKRARKVILKQLDYVNNFAKEHAEDFVVAKTPEELRDYVNNTNKTVIIHSVEGAKRLINNLEDAQFWAEQGVAFFTLMHLVDSEYGSAATREGMMTTLLNFKGAVKAKKKRGLKEKGKEAIKWLAQAGIMTDLTHMERQTRTDALAFMREHKIPPISTHDCPRSMRDNARAITEEEILEIYKLDGFIALPMSGLEMELVKAEQRYIDKEDSLVEAGCHCKGSIDSYKFMYEEMKRLIESNIGVIVGDSSLRFDSLTEEEKVRFSIGFQTDFNGWLSHSRPRAGKEGCYPIDSTKNYEAIELEGLAHPGLLPSQWRLLEKEGVDLDPLKRSAERFAQLWEFFRENKEQWGD